MGGVCRVWLDGGPLLPGRIGLAKLPSPLETPVPQGRQTRRCDSVRLLTAALCRGPSAKTMPRGTPQRRSCWSACLLALGLVMGCGHLAEWHESLAVDPPCESAPPGLVEPPAFPVLESPPPGMSGSNPVLIRANDSEFFWNQLVDTVDDYFTIASEHRIQVADGLVSEGYIETRPQPGGTVLEPWQLDSASVDALTLATLQSIRRQATVRVVPAAGGYQVFLQVQQELEDVNRPVLATPGSSTPRFDGTLVRLQDTRELGPVTLGWIPLGRDFALEQAMLQELSARLAP